MKNLKLFNLLSSLDYKTELPEFHRYLKQTHGSKEIMLKVFEYIKKFYPDFSAEKKLDIAFAYRKIFKEAPPSGKHQYKKLLNSLSDLHLALKDFLIAERIRQDPFARQTLWLAVLQQRKGMDTEFSRQATQFYAQTKAVNQKSSEDCLRSMVAGYYYYQHLILEKPFTNTNELRNCLDALVSDGGTLKLKIDFELEHLRKKGASVSLVKKTAKQRNSTIIAGAAHKPFLFLFYQEIYHLVYTEQLAHFVQLKKMLKAHASELSHDELLGILQYLYNYTATQIRMGKEYKFAIEMHELNVLSMELGLFGKKDAIPARILVNMINVACSAKDIGWAAAILQEQNAALPKEAKALANAIIAFEEKEFFKVKILLRPTKFKDYHLILRSKAQLLRTYYELEEDVDHILSYCAAFDIWLRRRRKPKTDAVEATLEFVKVFRMLLLEKTNKQKLLDYIEKNQNLYFRSWLLDKTKRYEARHGGRKRE